MNKIKEILKDGWDVFPPWLLAGVGFCNGFITDYIIWYDFR